MSLIITNKKGNRMSFLVPKIVRKLGKFKTFVYRKLIFNGIYTHFDNFVTSTYQIDLIHTLRYRYCRISPTELNPI